MGVKITKETVIISFDTSTTSSGYAVFKLDNKNNISLDSYGCLQLNEKDTEKRINDMVVCLLYRLNLVKPNYVVIEKPPYKKDPNTLVLLSEIIGAVRAWAIANNCDYKEYAVARWRKIVKEENETVPKLRELCKEWDIKKVHTLFNLDVNDDVADAILIGYARIREMLGIVVIDESKKTKRKKTKKKKEDE